jgi:hypothetical protein
VTSLERSWHKLSAGGMKWLWIGLAAIPATRLYYVREMVAALMIFSIFFAGAAMVVLVLFFIDLASQRFMVWAEAGVVRSLSWANEAVKGVAARPGWASVESHPSSILPKRKAQS